MAVVVDLKKDDNEYSRPNLELRFVCRLHAFGIKLMINFIYTSGCMEWVSIITRYNVWATTKKKDSEARVVTN